MPRLAPIGVKFPKSTLIPGGEEGVAIRKVLKLKREGFSYEQIEKMMNWPDDKGNTAWKIWKKFGGYKGL